MAAIRVHALLGLLALLAASARCWDGAAGLQAGLASRQSLLDLVLAALEELERGGGTRHSSSPLAFPSSEDLAGNAAEMSRIPSEIFFPIAIDTRDPSLKEKFIKHVTNKSSMYMSPECSRQFYRLYHNTRDCTVRSYYRRCARLLRRLTMSPLCTKS
ncbi:ALK and LTK ligand 2 [Petromyzon marinus]|uniref:ALK and LTK ligand 2 n=1 Tax=Petromyzon marinus TaxID=7757 RepID=A0AAJ7TGT9_PETMA|nr:ALK and LTK ligand 2 [Petromyzon marinus]